MKKYSVMIQGIVTKNVKVEANNEQEAILLAHENFSVLCDNDEENYEQNDLECQLIGDNS